MISPRLRAIATCPDCRCALVEMGDVLACPSCARRIAEAGDYLDLRPREAFSEQTKYLDDSLHADARHERLSPPLLGSKIRNDMLRAMLAPGPADLVVDLGCGSGRTMLWNADRGAAMVGIDVSPFFSVEARAQVDLVLGDLRRLPFGDGVFTKAYALDVMEHLSREALGDVLGEAARVLAPGGALFVYSHVRKNSGLANALRWTNRVAHALERRGWLDLRQERLRKSDHVNPLADVPDLERTVAAAGFRVDRIRYYTPVFGGFIENVVVRLVEQALGRRAARRACLATVGAQDGGPGSAARLARAEAKRRIAERGPTWLALRALTWLMTWDLWIFGRVRSGPFFARLVKMDAGPVERTPTATGGRPALR